MTTNGTGKARVRNVIAVLLAVVAVLLLVVGTVAVWARVTINSSDRVADLVGDALDEPDVEAALADYVTEMVFTAVDVDALLGEVLPEPLQRLEPVLASGARSFVERGMTAALSDPRVDELVHRLVVRAHAAAMRLLQGGGLADGISVVDGAVTINLLPLLGRGVDRVQELGLLTSVELPELSPDGDPAQQVADLEAALGRQLPDDFGQLVVYQSDQIAEAQSSLQRAQEAAAFARRAFWVLIALTVVLLVAAVVVAVNRWRAALFLGLGVVAAMVLHRALIDRVVDAAPDVADRPGARAAIASIVGGAATSLRRLAAIVLILGAAVAVIALARRRWDRHDLLLAAGVVAGAVVVGVLGFSIWSLLFAIVIGVAVVVVTPRVIGRSAAEASR